LPPGLSRREKRLAFAKRFYEGELPEAALIDANWIVSRSRESRHSG
jgi:hypothetical protein